MDFQSINQDQSLCMSRKFTENLAITISDSLRETLGIQLTTKKKSRSHLENSELNEQGSHPAHVPRRNCITKIFI